MPVTDKLHEISQKSNIEAVLIAHAHFKKIREEIVAAIPKEEPMQTEEDPSALWNLLNWEESRSQSDVIGFIDAKLSQCQQRIIRLFVLQFLKEVKAFMKQLRRIYRELPEEIKEAVFKSQGELSEADKEKFKWLRIDIVKEQYEQSMRSLEEGIFELKGFIATLESRMHMGEGAYS